MVAAACSGYSRFRSFQKPIHMVEVDNLDLSTPSSQHNKSLKALNVKETALKAAESLTTEGHRFEAMANQAAAGIKPKRVRALIQRGALR